MIDRPCGIVVQRDTFYGAEAVGTVAEMFKSTFRAPGTMPDHIIYDSNYLMKKLNDPAFEKVGMTVDVFHFKTKHKESDSYCQENCNAADYPELLGEDRKGWFFNSSIAEQTNTWFGGYQAICREMLVDKMIVAKLKKEGHGPSYWRVNASMEDKRNISIALFKCTWCAGLGFLKHKLRLTTEEKMVSCSLCQKENWIPLMLCSYWYQQKQKEEMLVLDLMVLDVDDDDEEEAEYQRWRAQQKAELEALEKQYWS
ncbi:hypothetical protein C8J56DRAFT_1050889 [Mycena floridula]|nr:hypothetical protein C8J56DRAFT_1050889 [Mycena floridula]